MSQSATFSQLWIIQLCFQQHIFSLQAANPRHTGGSWLQLVDGDASRLDSTISTPTQQINALQECWASQRFAPGFHTPTLRHSDCTGFIFLIKPIYPVIKGPAFWALLCPAWCHDCSISGSRRANYQATKYYIKCVRLNTSSIWGGPVTAVQLEIQRPKVRLNTPRKSFILQSIQML